MTIVITDEMVNAATEALLVSLQAQFVSRGTYVDLDSMADVFTDTVTEQIEAVLALIPEAPSVELCGSTPRLAVRNRGNMATCDRPPKHVGLHTWEIAQVTSRARQYEETAVRATMLERRLLIEKSTVERLGTQLRALQREVAGQPEEAQDAPAEDE